MKNYRWLLAGVVAGISALAVSSCAYDPYYSGGSYYSGGYGDGYGYGGSNFSTSFFVTTGDPRWGYDPYAGAYYDYTRRCYYDPYLSGYYPVGYRPRYVYGSPHPHGWTSGRRSISPPSRVRSYNLTNYQNRTERYRGLGRDWSRNVSTAPAGRSQSTTYGRNQSRSSSGGSRYNQGSIFGAGNQNSSIQRGGSRQYSQPSSNGYGRSGYTRGNNDNDGRRSGSSYGRGNVPSRPPVVTPQRGGVFGRSAATNPAATAQRNATLQGFTAPRSRPQPQVTPPAQQRVLPQPQPSGDGNGRGSRGGGGRSDEGRGRDRGPIGLGQG